MKIDARLTFDKIRYDQDLDAHLVLTLTAPPIEAQVKRPKLALIPLIDVSPSMYQHGGEKIAYAKRSVEKLIEHLGPDDYCGLVQFADTASVLQKPLKVTSDAKALLNRRVTELSEGSGTNIADALLLGLELGNKMDLPTDTIVRVILLTDGEANRGPETKAEGLIRLLGANLGGCTASAFGYGKDANQNLLGELAKTGSGNYAFIGNPDDALTAFGKELGGLLSTYGTNLILNVEACNSHEITSVISDVTAERDKVGQRVQIKIPDILAEEVRQIVLGVKFKAQPTAGPRAVNVFEVKAGWDILDANSKKERQGADVKAKAQFVKAGEEQKEAQAELDAIVGLAELIRGQLEAEEKAKKGDYAGAVNHMNGISRNLKRRKLSQLESVAGSISGKVSSAQAYSTGGSYLRSMSTGGTRGYGAASYDVSAASALQDLGVSLNNSVQTSTSTSFTTPQPAVDQGSIVGGGVVNPPTTTWTMDGLSMGGSVSIPAVGVSVVPGIVVPVTTTHTGSTSLPWAAIVAPVAPDLVDPTPIAPEIDLTSLTQSSTRW